MNFTPANRSEFPTPLKITIVLFDRDAFEMIGIYAGTVVTLVTNNVPVSYDTAVCNKSNAVCTVNLAVDLNRSVSHSVRTDPIPAARFSHVCVRVLLEPTNN